MFVAVATHEFFGVSDFIDFTGYVSLGLFVPFLASTIVLGRTVFLNLGRENPAIGGGDVFVNPRGDWPAGNQPATNSGGMDMSSPSNGGFNPGYPPPSGSVGQDYNRPQFRLQLYGGTDRLYSIADLAGLARSKSIQPSTGVIHMDSQFPVAASTIPGVFSDKEYVTALLLSFFLGAFGIDRFYLGYTGLGIGKLLTFGGCGVWALIDLILIAMRNVPDSEGRPLS